MKKPAKAKNTDKPVKPRYNTYYDRFSMNGGGVRPAKNTKKG